MSHRILIVDEIAASRELMEAAVAAIGGIEVVTAPSGFDALELLPRHRFDVIIASVNTPDVSGLELINFVKRTPSYRGTPLVLIGEPRHEEDRRRGLSLGATAYLERPLAAGDLTALLCGYLRREEAAVAITA